MQQPWETDNCVAMKAHYTVYSIPQAAALWCGVPENQIDQIVRKPRNYHLQDMDGVYGYILPYHASNPEAGPSPKQLKMENYRMGEKTVSQFPLPIMLLMNADIFLAGI